MSETRERFDAAKWTPERRVVTRSGQEVRILCVDGPDKNQPVIGILHGDVVTWGSDGLFLQLSSEDSTNDLFFATPSPDYKQLLQDLVIAYDADRPECTVAALNAARAALSEEVL